MTEKTEIPESKNSLSKKERRQAKRAQRPNADLALKLLHLWEKLRPVNTPKNEKEKLCDEIIELSKDKIPELQSSHDCVRVFQSVLKFGQMRHRDVIYKAIIKDIISLSKAKYGHFLVRKAIKYGTVEQRCHIFQAFQPHVRRLMCHKFSSELLDYAFNEFADRKYRARLMQGLFGNYFLVFHDDDLTSIKMAIQKYPTKRKSILIFARKSVMAAIRKKLHGSVFTQHILFQLLDFYHEQAETSVGEEKMEVDRDNEDEGEQSDKHTVAAVKFTENIKRVRDEFVEALVEDVLPLVYTKEGVKCAQRVFAWCNAKQRKRFLRSLATFIAPLAKHEHGFLLLLTIFETMDDVVTLNKFALKELMSSLDELVSTVHGRFVLFHLLCGHDPAHFPVYLRELLRSVEKNEHSKKPSEVRQKEICQIVAPTILEYAIANLGKLLKRNSTVLLLLEIVIRSAEVISDISPIEQLLSALCQYLNEPFKPLDPKSELAQKIAERTRLKRQYQTSSDTNEVGSKKGKYKKRSTGDATGDDKKAKPLFRLMPQQEDGKEVATDKTIEEQEEQDIDSQLHVIERAATHILFRRLNQWDKQRVQNGHSALFAPLVVNIVQKNRILSWLPNNRGCFFLVHLLEVGDLIVSKKLVTILTPVSKEIGSSQLPGAKILFKKLSEV